jgi:hypothetical protein
MIARAEPIAGEVFCSNRRRAIGRGRSTSSAAFRLPSGVIEPQPEEVSARLPREHLRESGVGSAGLLNSAGRVQSVFASGGDDDIRLPE